MGVSATLIREALAKLEAEGIVAFQKNLRYHIQDAPADEEFALWAEARIGIETLALLNFGTRPDGAFIARLATLIAAISDGPACAGTTEISGSATRTGHFTARL